MVFVCSVPASSSYSLFSFPPLSSNSRLSPFHIHCHYQYLPITTFISSSLRCQAVTFSDVITKEKDKSKKKKNEYDIQYLTTWLLKQEQDGQIDAELTIVLSSISLACKQIASLLQRSSIISLTGGQGTINVQGEDQKKLDVISNEVNNWICSFFL